jgi:HAD superfamily hydrolase (TIGR01509 family)
VVFAEVPERPVTEWRMANGGQLRVNAAAELVDDEYRGFETGRVPEAQYTRHLRSRLGWTGSDEDLIRIWNSSQGSAVLKVLDTLEGLRDRGWQLVAATNTNPWHERARREEFGWVLALFDRVVTSTQVGARKPDPRFFAELLRGVPRHGPQIYVDDDPQVVSAARRAGIDGHVFGDAQGLLAACRSLVMAAS